MWKCSTFARGQGLLAQERQTGFHEVGARVRDDLLHRCPPAQSVVAFRIDPLAKF